MSLIDEVKEERVKERVREKMREFEDDNKYF